jgi:formylmethanofuran dehydrogenase subunit E
VSNEWLLPAGPFLAVNVSKGSAASVRCFGKQSLKSCGSGKLAMIQSITDERQVSRVELTAVPPNPDRLVWAAADIRQQNPNVSNQSRPVTRLASASDR